MLKEFKKFIMTGNVIEFAVAMIMAGAINLVVKGFVNDIVMPMVAYLVGDLDFSDMKYVLSEAVTASEGIKAKAEIAIRYGNWITAIVNLILVGFVMFILVKAYNKTKKPKEEPAKPKGPSQEELLAEIRDLLKNKA